MIKPEFEIEPNDMLVCHLQKNNRYECRVTKKLERIDDPLSAEEHLETPSSEIIGKYSYIIGDGVPTQVRSRGLDRVILSSQSPFNCEKKDQQRDVGTPQESNIDILVCQPSVKPMTLLEYLFPLHPFF